ncbi:MAG: hypothetical protein ACI8TV_000605 [Porticoccaceae bacterium]|jgi:hypothetical protein
MIHGLSKHTRGAGAALAYFLDEDFLDKYTKKWRKREPGPQLIIGDVQLIKEICGSSGYKHKYTSGVLSFTSEETKRIEATSGMKSSIIEELREFAYAGFLHDDSKFLCVVQHTHLDRLELHYLIPRINAESGLYFNPFPPNYSGQKGPGSNEIFKRQNDIFVDYVCSKYGLQSPRSVELKRKTKVPTFEDQNITKLRQKVADQISLRVDSGEISNRDDMFKFLGKYHAEITRCGDDYFSVKFPGGLKPVRLKGEIYGANSTQAIEQRRLAAIEVRLPVNELTKNYHTMIRERARQVESRHGKRSVENDLAVAIKEYEEDLHCAHEILSGEYHEIDSEASAAAAAYIKENLGILEATAANSVLIGGATISNTPANMAAGNTNNYIIEKMFVNYVSWKKEFLRKEANLAILEAPWLKQAVLSSMRAKSHSIDLKMSVFTSYNFVEPGKGHLTANDAKYYKKAIAKEVLSARSEMSEAVRKEAEHQALQQAVQAGNHVRAADEERNLRQAIAKLRQKLARKRQPRLWKELGGPAFK